MSIHLSPFLYRYFLVLAALFGAVMGSFLHCATYRLVHGGSVLRGRSRCPACGHVLGPGDLIPVVSWLALRGKCRYCCGPIHWRYPVSEGTMALLTALCLARFDLTLLCLRNWILLACLFTLTITDLEDRTIPDLLLAVPAGVWAATAPFLLSGWREAGLHLAAGLCFGGAVLGLSLWMDRRLGRESLGGGDVKLIALMGLYLGFPGAMLALILGCILGLAVIAFRRDKKAPIPFGPALAAATGGMLLYGEKLVTWYCHLLF